MDAPELGSLRHVVKLEGPSGPPVPDGDGGYTVTYAPLTPADWDCAIEPLSGGDTERALGSGAVVTVQTFEVRGRYHPGITVQTRFHTGGRGLQVQSVRNDGTRDRWLTLTCTEISRDGH